MPRQAKRKTTAKTKRKTAPKAKRRIPHKTKKGRDTRGQFMEHFYQPCTKGSRMRKAKKRK
jgi:hypothetical protein